MVRVALKGLFAHKLRFLLTTFAVVVGVGFVVGSFVLSDSVRAQFDQLFEEIYADVDLSVRPEERFDQGAFADGAGSVDAALLPEIEAVDGVAEVAGNAQGAPALPINAEGEAVRPGNAFPLGLNWTGGDLNSLTLTQGTAPESDDEVVMDVDLADAGDFRVGDAVTIQTPLGPVDYRLSGIATFGESNSLAGATITAFTTAEAQRIFNLEDRFNEIAISVEDGVDPETVQGELESFLPEGVEVVDGATVIEENQESVGDLVSAFGNVLLGFALVTLFVSAFLINNTFTIVVSQRVRELALLRAVGATERQVAAAVLIEAFAVGVIASIVGFGLGLLTATAINGVLNSAGFGAGDTSLVIGPVSIIAAVGVGIGITMVASLLPAWRATTVPPVAAMREGFSLSAGSLRPRSIAGAVLAVVGGAAIAFALFGDPGTVGLLVGLAGGALMVFLGLALLTPLFASPVARAIGRPFAGIYHTPGQLAEENAARSPRRTASTASALMIGLALVSMALVVGNSIKVTFIDTLSTSITADWYLDGGGFIPFSPEAVREISELPQIGATTDGRFGAMQVDGTTRQFSAVNYDTLTQLFELDITDGGVESGDRGLLVNADPAADLGLAVGDTVEVVFNSTGPKELPVVAIYEDSSVVGNWVLDLETYEENFTERVDFWAAAKNAEGVTDAEVRPALEEIVDAYPGVRVQSRDEFQADQEQQLDQFLLIINAFLLIAIVVAFIGIVNTLALSVFERTRELGLLRAVGMTAKQVRRMVRLEAVIVAVFGALLGVLVGVIFGLAVSTALPDDFVREISVPVPSLIILVVLAGLLGVVAAVWPAYRAGRLNILDAISFE